MEEWANITGYDGIYMVSNLGNIKRIQRGKGVKPNRILKPYLMPNGYLQVALSKNSVETKFYVHRLVLTAFAPNESADTVNHINGDKSDNRLVNLEYMTRAENTSHSNHVLGNAKRGEKNANAKLRSDDVLKIKELIKVHTHQFVSEMFGVSRPTITEISIGRKWKHL